MPARGSLYAIPPDIEARLLAAETNTELVSTIGELPADRQTGRRPRMLGLGYTAVSREGRLIRRAGAILLAIACLAGEG